MNSSNDTKLPKWVITIKSKFFKKQLKRKGPCKELVNLHKLALNDILDLQLYCEFFKWKEEALRDVQNYQPTQKKLTKSFTREIPSSIPPKAEEIKASLSNTMDTILSPELGNHYKSSTTEDNRKAFYWYALHFNYANMFGENIFICC